ncbi:Farnesol dehydrogenase [Gryllus bimaculatus]|nr:Farnesol dehydrogenase [Gryllus bimaculatus]
MGPGRRGAGAGRSALVTGANSGIGAAITRRLLALGLTVAALDRQVEQLQILALGRVGAGGAGRLRPLQCDLHAEQEALAAVEWAERELPGGPSLLVVPEKNGAWLVSPGLTRTRLLLEAAGASAHARAFGGGAPALAPHDVAAALDLVLAQPPSVQERKRCCGVCRKRGPEAEKLIDLKGRT